MKVGINGFGSVRQALLQRLLAHRRASRDVAMGGAALEGYSGYNIAAYDKSRLTR